MPFPGFFLWLVTFSILAAGCGRFKDKFGRIEEERTQVSLENDRGALSTLTLNGGILVYFEDKSDSNKFFIFKLNNDSETRSVTVPNGVYKVYAVGFSGSNNLEGNGYCSLGDGGADVSLSGAAKTVTLTFSQSNCSF